MKFLRNVVVVAFVFSVFPISANAFDFSQLATVQTTLNNNFDNIAVKFYCFVNDGLLGLNSCKPKQKKQLRSKKTPIKTPIKKQSSLENIIGKPAFKPSIREEKKPIYTTVNKITQPVIERIYHTKEIVKQSGLTRAEFEQNLNKLRQELYSSQSVAQAPIYQAIALTNKIDNLSGVTINTSTISGTPISGSTGSFTTLSVSGDTTLAGNLTVSGTTLLNGSTTITNLIAPNSIIGNATTTGDSHTGGSQTIAGDLCKPPHTYEAL